MLVVHMDSGLGNQMLDYAEYLTIQKCNPDQKCYLENLIYELPKKPGMFSMWNGYELNRIFGIEVPNVKELFTEEQWKQILVDVEASEFWLDDWNFSPHIVKAFEKQGLRLNNYGKIPGKKLQKPKNWKEAMGYLKAKMLQTKYGYHMKRIIRSAFADRIIVKDSLECKVFRKYPEDSFVGHSLAYRYKASGIEKMEDEIREVFQFPEIKDENNQRILDLVKSTNSVSIHARRSDLLFVNGYCYKFGFFKRSVKYIKKVVKDPIFVFFTDEKSVGWCEENETIFGLDFSKDQVEFVTWNKGEDSFRDMQLMAECKHNIITESSFGFWGAYLNRNPEKIVCAPDIRIWSTHSF